MPEVEIPGGEFNPHLVHEERDYDCGCSAHGPVIEGEHLPDYCPEHGRSGHEAEDA
jgi:hypothetical protein